MTVKNIINKYSLGRDTSKVALLFKDIKDCNKYLLSLIGIFVLLLSGIISYNYTNTSYAKWSSSIESNKTIRLYIKSNLDTSGANKPFLASNMIPIYYDTESSSWKKADVSNSSKKYQWYDYDNKMWANAVTVSSTNRTKYLNADIGTEIKMDDINTMWVWIPRYKYTIFPSIKPQDINIKFESGTESTGTAKCFNTYVNNANLEANSTTCTHPAFTFGDQELTGIWVGKFENSATTIPTKTSTEDSIIIIKPDVQSLRYKTISYMFKDIRQMEASNNIYGFEQSNSTTFNWNGSLTGDTNDIDIHMIKNIEWGAIAYLSHSKYGINKEININNSRGCYTGRSGGDVGGSTEINKTYEDQTSTTQYNTYGFYTYDGYLLEYNTNTKSTTRDMNKIASTTGNITGIYDMSGGAWDYTMSSGSSSSFGVGKAENWTSTYPLSKYYNHYNYYSEKTTNGSGLIGDSTQEIQENNSLSNGGWYKDYTYYPYDTYSFFVRGGLYSHTTYAGIFAFYFSDGSSISTRASRSVLSMLK